MSAPEKIPLSGLPRGELEAVAERLLAENAALKRAIAELRAEAALGGPAAGDRGRDLQAPGGPVAERGPGRLPRRGARGAAGRTEHRALDQRRRHQRPPPAPQRRLYPAGQRPLRRLRHDGLEE